MSQGHDDGHSAMPEMTLWSAVEGDHPVEWSVADPLMPVAT